MIIYLNTLKILLALKINIINYAILDHVQFEISTSEFRKKNVLLSFSEISYSCSFSIKKY